jgi:hypothetical protein
MTPEADSGRSDRGPDGRFQHGNRCAKGNPVARRQRELSEAIRSAVTAEDLHAVFAGLLVSARAGDAQAAQLLLAYAIGKPAAATTVCLDDVPGLRTGEDIAVVAARVVDAVTAGAVSVEAGEALLRLVSTATDLLIVRQLEERLERLEQQA